MSRPRELPPSLSLPLSISHGVLPPRRTGLAALVLGMLALHRQRRKLAALDDARLADIGLTRDEALREAARPVWDSPPHWRA